VIRLRPRNPRNAARPPGPPFPYEFPTVTPQIWLRARSPVASSVTRGSSHQIGTQRGSLDASSHKGHEFDLYFGKYSRDRQLEHKNEKYLASTLNQYPFLFSKRVQRPAVGVAISEQLCVIRKSEPGRLPEAPCQLSGAAGTFHPDHPPRLELIELG